MMFFPPLFRELCSAMLQFCSGKSEKKTPLKVPPATPAAVACVSTITPKKGDLMDTDL